jgi:hypothetical protein
VGIDDGEAPLLEVLVEASRIDFAEDVGEAPLDEVLTERVVVVRQRYWRRPSCKDVCHRQCWCRR